MAFCAERRPFAQHHSDAKRRPFAKRHIGAESRDVAQRRAGAPLPGRRRLRLLAFALCLLLAAGCASLPPGACYPKAISQAYATPGDTPLGQAFAAASAAHQGRSGFRILTMGEDGFLTRAQMIDAATRAIDVQYFIFRSDVTGSLLTEALLRAADRGVRVRILLDDGETTDGDEKIAALLGHPNLSIRMYNPFRYRGQVLLLKAAEFMLDKSRLNSRMHNKLLVVDNSVALVGGRNVGDGYFQVDPDLQFADDDIFCAGPVVRQLSMTFDDYWNSGLSIPLQALSRPGKPLELYRRELQAHREALHDNDVLYARRVATGEPLHGMTSGALPLVWAPAHLVYDSPDKARVARGEAEGWLMRGAMTKKLAEARGELLMVTPYLIPGEEGMRALLGLRERGADVRILTNSLPSSTVLVAHSGYIKYREGLVAHGVKVYEARAWLGSTKGSGQSRSTPPGSRYSLHAKLFVFDRRQVFFGSMNYDMRSMHINTEIGLFIDSRELAEQTAGRFAAMTDPKNCYQVLLEAGPGRVEPRLAWRTEEDGVVKVLPEEPASSPWQRLTMRALSLLPLDADL